MAILPHRITRHDPPHISAYALTVEPGTPLADQRDQAPDDDDQADKYVVADEVLSSAGLANYEVSNWESPGHECRHNLLYWRQGITTEGSVVPLILMRTVGAGGM